MKTSMMIDVAMYLHASYMFVSNTAYCNNLSGRFQPTLKIAAQMPSSPIRQLVSAS